MIRAVVAIVTVEEYSLFSVTNLEDIIFVNSSKFIYEKRDAAL